MQTRRYKSLKNMFKALKLDRITFEELGRQQVYDNIRHEWIHFVLPDDELEEAFFLLAGAICFRRPAQMKYASLMRNYWGKWHGIFSRLWIERKNQHKFVLTSTYCAGQDWEGEVKYVKNLIRN